MRKVVRTLPVSPWPVLVLFIAIAIPSAGYGSAQSGDTLNSNLVAGNVTSPVVAGNVTSPVVAGNVTSPVVAGNVTDLADNVTRSVAPPFANDTETSIVNRTIIVVNEIELNPQGSDADQEWIELYNQADVDANISNFEIMTSFNSATVKLPSEAVISANGTYVVELDGQILSDTAESLVLANASGEIIDRTPSLVDKSDDGRTWQRIPDGNNEWQFAAGTRDELNDPNEQASATRAAIFSSEVQCQGTAGCAEGMVIRIVDGDTIYVSVDGTIYKIDLALASAPSVAQEGFIEATSFTRSMCLGSNVLVDQDDKLLTSDNSIIAVVYCASANLNSELLDNSYAALNISQCQTSEFASQNWAKEHGC